MNEFNPVDILLVEDNPSDVGLIVRVLKKHNLANAIHVAKDGAEALDFMFARGAYAARSEADPPKVVFLDIKLPKVDGLEVLKEIKSDERTKTIPVIMLTSSKEGRDLTEAYKLGVNSYVVKPVNFPDLAKAVAEIGLYWMVLNKQAA